MTRVLCVCIENAGRSQMAHAPFERAAREHEARLGARRPRRPPPEEVRRIRDDIARRVDALAAEV